MTAPAALAVDDPSDVDAVLAAVADFATLVHDVECLRARLDLAADGATSDELAAMNMVWQIDLVQWKGEQLPVLRAWLSDHPAPQVH
jgi:hypothetical protein